MQGLKTNLAGVLDGRLRTAPVVRAAGDDDNNNKKRAGDRNPGTAVITKTKTQTKRPTCTAC